jgi:hypothetical protein
MLSQGAQHLNLLDMDYDQYLTFYRKLQQRMTTDKPGRVGGGGQEAQQQQQQQQQLMLGGQAANNGLPSMLSGHGAGRMMQGVGGLSGGVGSFGE